MGAWEWDCCLNPGLSEYWSKAIIIWQLLSTAKITPLCHCASILCCPSQRKEFWWCPMTSYLFFDWHIKPKWHIKPQNLAPNCNHWLCGWPWKWAWCAPKWRMTNWPLQLLFTCLHATQYQSWRGGPNSRVKVAMWLSEVAIGHGEPA